MRSAKANPWRSKRLSTKLRLSAGTPRVPTRTSAVSKPGSGSGTSTGIRPRIETAVGRSMWLTRMSIAEPSRTSKSIWRRPEAVRPAVAVAFSLRMTVALSDSKTMLPSPSAPTERTWSTPGSFSFDESVAQM